jgi:sugar lactone lactonase YvrE
VVVRAHTTDNPRLFPVRFSSDGRYLAWGHRKAPWKIDVSDNKELLTCRVPGNAESWAFVGDAALWVVREGAVVCFDARTGNIKTLTMPEGEVPTAVGGALQHLFVGTEAGHVYRW